VRYAIVGVLALAAFFGAYKFATAGSASGAGSTPAQPGAAQSSAGLGGTGGCCGGGTGATGAGTGSSASGGCCGGGTAAAAAPVEGAAKVSGGVQKIYVAVKLQYNPNVIHLKAGLPAEITFSSAQGCTGYVQSQDLGFQEDLTTGQKTVKLQGLKPGTYGFACAMNMVQGKVVVE
jgi:plastocyanin